MTKFKPQPIIRNLFLLPLPKIIQTVLNFPFTRSTVCNKLFRALKLNKDTLSGSSTSKNSKKPNA